MYGLWRKPTSTVWKKLGERVVLPLRGPGPDLMPQLAQQETRPVPLLSPWPGTTSISLFAVWPSLVAQMSLSAVPVDTGQAVVCPCRRGEVFNLTFSPVDERLGVASVWGQSPASLRFPVCCLACSSAPLLNTGEAGHLQLGAYGALGKGAAFSH